MGTEIMPLKGSLAIAALAVAASLLAPKEAIAASLAGTVTTTDGKAVMGALVTVFNEAKDRRETVYTAADGRYAIHTDFAGKLDVRARVANFEDTRTTVTLEVDQPATVDLTVKPFASAQAASDALSASAHNAKLGWPRAGDRAPFVSQCNYCHQLGNALTRTPKSHEVWLSTIARMEGYFAMLSAREIDTVTNTLTKGFDGKPVEAVHNYGATPELARAKTEEWLVGDALSFIHDLDVGDDEKLYGTDEGHDLIWILDRTSGKIEKIPLPDIDLPEGGKFSGFRLPIGVFTGKHGPHSMAQAKDGKFWITNALSSTIMSFDPATKAFKTYPVGHDALYPHTIRIDRDGIVWFTIVCSNQIGRFDPRTEQMTVLSLPANGFWRWVSDLLFPTLVHLSSWFPQKNLALEFSHQKFFGHDILAFPYGIDVNPKDGSIWYAKLYASKIGRIDPGTLEVVEFDTPMKGPRRPRFDRNGVLWIPSFDEGGLMAFDTTRRTFESMKLPLLAAGEYEIPYALNVHPTTGDVWITANNSDRVIRYTPATKTFQSYPSPTRVTVLRDMSFTKDGRVCSSQSNLPAYGIEDGVPSFICIDPEGADKDRAALARTAAAPVTEVTRGRNAKPAPASSGKRG
jgi:virginiamycin B lyase